MDFSPSVYEHAARVIGRSPWEASRDGHLLLQGHQEAFRLYGHAPVVVGIDIYNLEAEAYGATVAEPNGDGIPAISEHVFSSARDLMGLDPLDPKRDGRIPMVVDVGRRLAEEFPAADVRIPVSGPFSVASNLIGFDTLLCEILDAPELVLEGLRHLIQGQAEFCREVVRQGLDIAFFESAAAPPLISPEMFRDLELPALKAILEQAAAIVRHPVPCIIGGDTAPILESILATGTGYVICPAETDQAVFMEGMKTHPEVMVRVNMNPGILSAGDLDAAFREVDRILALVRDREKACIGTGALPFETDPAVVIKTRDYVAEVS